MTETLQRSYLRDSHGPRAVDAGAGRSDKGRGSSRRHKDGDDKNTHRSSKDSSKRTSQKDSTHRRKHSSSQTSDYTETSCFELDVIGQPPSGVALGLPIETSVLVSLKVPATDQTVQAESIDTSRFFAVASLVADSRGGERVPLEAGIMTGQKMFDSVHAMPDECADRLAANQPHRLVLGYFSFPGLLIRQSGTYRVRTTLIKMSSSGQGGGSSIVAVDSEPIKVERRSIATPRRHQRVYS